MIANVSAHRRANAFAQALEEQTPPGQAAEDRPPAASGEQPGAAPAERAEESRMLSLAAELGEVPRPQLDPEVRTVQRAQLVAAMEAMAGSAPDPSVPEQRSGRGAHRASPLRKLRPRSRLTKGLAAGGLTVGVAAGAFGGVAAASSDALPGDSLYGLKRGMEDIKLGMAGDAADRGGIYLDHASTRLSEARRLMERGRSGSLDHESLAEIRRALGAVHHDAGQGHRLLSAAYQEGGSLQPIQQLSSFSQSHRATWTSLRDQLPPTLFDVSDQVSEVFDAIEEEVEPLRSLLPGAPSQDDRPGGSPAPGSSPPAGTGSVAPGEPDPSGSAEREGGGQGGTGEKGSPKPSADDQQDDGLLGGSTGGLLDPPRTGQDSPAPSQEQREPGTAPDVTLPPLLPGLLPGLGIDAGDRD
ncbi:DUF5667 domain-containing protein [Streptomyces albidoflavus]|uniref:DUF5667 domain-containing protein n=1 Tax=Streptomyces albidoflavus TaxID=1886 RepID=A0A8G1ZVC2_9ACTN|nr:MULTISPECIES: DUF5667 domain-containing protein [Streptomyces]MYX86824.1 hypothetical protein [Streptomyces sp. SID4915]QLA58291.1 hypothetical protein HWN34_17955 [Streptomyces violascens]AWL32891.1 hypothetical protein B9S66_12180 [Streptomyces sp. SM17]KUL62846.1 hypothetical protein ADL32_11180 [Streptomyces albidoflavus]MCL6275699.1 DUF5667 domain-containing protein [Streptomyces albidoflavus]